MTHIIILILLIHLAEVVGHYWVITERNQMTYDQRNTIEAWTANSEWHQYFATMSLLIWITLSIALQDWRPLMYGFVIRLFTHQIVLNYLRDLPIAHLGSGFVDSIFKRIGEWPTVIIKIAMLVAIFFV